MEQRIHAANESRGLFRDLKLHGALGFLLHYYRRDATTVPWHTSLTRNLT